MASEAIRQRRQAAEPFFSQPIRQVLLVLLALGLFAAGAWLAYPRVAPVFLSNPALNGIILVVFALGLLACFWQLGQLIRAVGWVLAFTGGHTGEPRDPGPLLAPLAALLRNRGPGTALSATAARSILESVTTRIDEGRDITRYIANLLIFLGLLGTFYGLATTVPAVVDTIRSLAPSEGEGANVVFGRLMSGLEDQLGGMGTAFASSLLGLAGSLIVGLLDLFVSHGQNRFARELEDWLSSITRLGFAPEGEGAADGAVLEAFAEHLVVQLDRLQELFAEVERARAAGEQISLAALQALPQGLAEGVAQSVAAALAAARPEADTTAQLAAQLAAALEDGLRRQGEVQAQAVERLAARLAEGQERTAATLREGLAEARAEQAPQLAALAEGQAQVAAAVAGQGAQTAEALARLAEAQAQVTAALQAQGAGTAAALARLAEAGAQQQAGTAPLLARLAEGQDQLAATLREGLARQQAQEAASPPTARLLEGQQRLAAALEAAAGRLEAGEARLQSALAESGGYGDGESRMRLRSIDVQLLRILEEMAAGRQEAVQELRTELAALSRALRQTRETPEIAFPGRRG